ncbi:MAG: ChaN family lipoprotein [Polaromonas sp.]
MSYFPPFSSPPRFAALFLATSLTVAGGCASRPEAPILELPAADKTSATSARLAAMLPTDVLLVGEQHDAADHHQLEQQIISELAAKGLLAAVALEMSDVGLSTAKLQPSSSEEQTRRALKWDDKGWPWAAYAPAVMTAVRAGVPVLGANLPREQMAASMEDRTLDARLPGAALKAQQQAIRIGHCNQLPETQITPMTRIQIAKDITMAGAVHQAALPGKVVVLLAGNGHVDRQLGVPRYLAGDLKARVIHLRAGPAETALPPDTLDSVWATPALPATDYCADLKQQLAPKP